MTGIDTCDIVKNRLKLVIGSHRLDIEFSHRNKQRSELETQKRDIKNKNQSDNVKLSPLVRENALSNNHTIIIRLTEPVLNDE